MFLGLRKTKGVSDQDFQEQFQVSFFDRYGSVIEKHLKNGLLMQDCQRIYLSKKGLDLANVVMKGFVLLEKEKKDYDQTCCNVEVEEEAEGATKAENARKIKQMLEALPDKISQLKSLEVGINILDSDAAYDAVLITKFDSVETGGFTKTTRSIRRCPSLCLRCALQGPW